MALQAIHPLESPEPRRLKSLEDLGLSADRRGRTEESSVASCATLMPGATIVCLNADYPLEPTGLHSTDQRHTPEGRAVLSRLSGVWLMRSESSFAEAIYHHDRC